LYIANKSLENVATLVFFFFGTAVTRQNYIHVEVKSTLNSRTVFSHSVYFVLLPAL